jgi:lysophospholipase L1-like esterase
MPSFFQRSPRAARLWYRVKSCLFHALLILMPLVLVECLSAIYLNFLAANPRPLALRNIPWHFYEPYRNHALGPGWHSKGIVHNSQGFRRTSDVPLIKPANGYRIFLMGGSAAYGLSAAPPFPPVVITNEQTIDYKLEQLLRPLFPEMHIEVINAAVTAYWTHHHLIYLHETLLDYNPDLIIFLDGINDYYYTNPQHRQFLSYKYSMTLKAEELNHPRPIYALHMLLDWSKQYSHTLFIVNEIADRLLRWNEPPDDWNRAEVIRPENLNAAFLERYEAIAKRTWVRTLRSILLLLNDQGVAAITSLQPELVFSQTQGMSAGDLRLQHLELTRRAPYYKERKEFLKPVTGWLASATAREFGATFVDLTDVFDDHAQYFIDYCHLSEAGAERVAEQLLPYIKEKIAQEKKGQ